MFTQQNSTRGKVLRYLWPIIFTIVFAVVGAWGNIAHETSITYVIVIAYLAIFFGIVIVMGIRSTRTRFREIEEYMKVSKTGAVEKLTRDDFMKAMEKDPEYMQETNKFVKSQMKNMVVLMVVLIGLLMLYTYVLSGPFISLAKYISNTVNIGYYLKPWFTQTIEEANLFYAYFIDYLIYFGVFFVLMYVIFRVMRMPFMTTSVQISNFPYTINKELIIFKDAMLIDGMYLLKSPIPVKQVIINEKRRFVEFELVKPLPGFPYSKIRIYHKSPRELWDKAMKNLFRVESENK
ncbi:DUF2208 family protein [Vulcanisaeta souniana]|uniref:DUF2208 domain-containing protein n=1 Tax=Vulcanisaeta souniana JCM 11219 TaxID=1293586 RepID=A0A830E6B0_9CREN|nr:DUF2208 family protein [Vulcanisaeta souniana]BDR93116.1 hypothetical protein Vsou_22090 [Vulcanisaeta souniana JCM 11219]GGI86874.1 hypothetical protein GCM10007112_24760 [Vulcanisaeta souniana JCM 11219]